jgi:hypothetical protein
MTQAKIDRANVPNGRTAPQSVTAADGDGLLQLPRISVRRPVGEGWLAMRPLSLWLFAALALASAGRGSAQQLTFARQVTVGKHQPLELWYVSGSANGSLPPATAAVYQIAMKHGVSFLDETVAEYRLNLKQNRSLAARLFSWGSYFELGATEMVNLHVIQANSQVSIALNVAMGIVNALLPSVQKSIPASDPSVLVRTGTLVMDSQGSVSGLFWAEQSSVQGFIDTAP